MLRGRPDIVWTGDAAADSGRARVTLPSGSGRAQLLLVDDYVYARGDPAGLRYELNLTKAQAKTYAGRWISFPKSDSLYTEIDTGLTLASIVHDVTFAQITGNPLPVAWRTGAGSEFESGSFSKWNEPVNVHAPASSTPIETVRRG